MIGDHIGMVVEVYEYLSETVLAQKLDDMLHDRFVGDRNHRLRDLFGQRAQPGSQARGQNHSPHLPSSSIASFRIPASSGCRIMPFSLMIAAINSAGVTSKAKFRAATLSPVICFPPRLFTSSGSRSSMGMERPSGILKST